MDKPSLRKDIRNKIRACPGKSGESLAVIEAVKADPAFREAHTVLAFRPMSDEPDITPLFDERFLFPYTEGGRMKFGRGPFRKSSMGFMEPIDKEEAPYDRAYMLVPGVAFTRDGKRMGRGGGFYDEYIHEHREKLHTVGVCFSVQLLDSLDTEDHDEILDEVISGQ